MSKAIKPKGWLLDFLKTQKSGLTGHMEKAGYPYNETYWGATEYPPFEGTFWWPFEQTAYHLDGMIRTAILLQDEEMLRKAENVIYAVINHPDEDGYLGPVELKEQGNVSVRWSHVVFFRACLALYEYNHDEKIVEAMTKHYLGHSYDYSLLRDVLNVEIMLELYHHNSNRALLDLAVDHFNRGYDNIVTRTLGRIYDRAHIHAVTYNEYAKLGALLYRATGEYKYLRDSVRAYEKVIKKYMLPGGVVSSSEYLLTDRYDEVYELCNVSDMTWSLHYLAEITDDIKYSDMIETCIFNAGIGSVTEDFRALQYFSCANQLLFNEESSHCRYDIGGKSMTYAPMPFTACCPGNMNRFMPNYVMSMWSQDEDVVTARMYGPSDFTGDIAGKEFVVKERTTYPFDLTATFEVETEKPFTLRLRIPEWCTNFKVDGTLHTVNNGYAVVKVAESMTISVVMETEILQKQNHGGVYFIRGPLVYTLGMKGKRETFGDDDFPTYRIEPNRKWNYAIDTKHIPVFQSGKDTIWDVNYDLPTLTVKAQEVTNWNYTAARKRNTVDWQYNIYAKYGKWTFTPRLPRRGCAKLDDKMVTLKLVPYGAAKVRMTVLPKIEA